MSEPLHIFTAYTGFEFKLNLYAVFRRTENENSDQGRESSRQTEEDEEDLELPVVKQSRAKKRASSVEQPWMVDALCIFQDETEIIDVFDKNKFVCLCLELHHIYYTQE